MASPVSKPPWLVTNGNSSVVVQSSISITSLVGPLAKRGISVIVIGHGMIADGHGTDTERRLSRLPRERDLQLIPFLCFVHGVRPLEHAFREVFLIGEVCRGEVIVEGVYDLTPTC